MSHVGCWWIYSGRGPSGDIWPWAVGGFLAVGRWWISVDDLEHQHAKCGLQRRVFMTVFVFLVTTVNTEEGAVLHV